MKLSIEIDGNIDTIALWHLIEPYKINLTAIGNKTYIYGDVALHNVGPIVERCSLFGDVEVRLSEGG